MCIRDSGYAINLLVGDITIEKANLDSYWFYLPVDSITYGAVSYTHLDVYKRQCLWWRYILMMASWL